MFPPIFQICAANAAVKAALGTSPVRLFPFGEAPQDVIKPYAVWQQYGGQPENFLAQRPDLDTISLQVDVYAVTGAAATSAAKAIRDAIELRAHITRWGAAERDPSTGNYRVSFDVDWLTPR
ncbi:tail completion protein gp17 [Metapseudomonas furukawaii]